MITDGEASILPGGLAFVAAETKELEITCSELSAVETGSAAGVHSVMLVALGRDAIKLESLSGPAFGAAATHALLEFDSGLSRPEFLSFGHKLPCQLGSLVRQPFGPNSSAGWEYWKSYSVRALRRLFRGWLSVAQAIARRKSRAARRILNRWPLSR